MPLTNIQTTLVFQDPIVSFEDYQSQVYVIDDSFPDTFRDTQAKAHSYTGLMTSPRMTARLTPRSSFLLSQVHMKQKNRWGAHDFPPLRVFLLGS